jgi:hypothetical protein
MRIADPSQPSAGRDSFASGCITLASRSRQRADRSTTIFAAIVSASRCRKRLVVNHQTNPAERLAMETNTTTKNKIACIVIAYSESVNGFIALHAQLNDRTHP